MSQPPNCTRLHLRSCFFLTNAGNRFDLMHYFSHYIFYFNFPLGNSVDRFQQHEALHTHL